MQFKNIEDYGIIGNLETCALIGKDGSIDWLCLPELESPSVFAAILDVEKGGHFYIKPLDKFNSIQRYLSKTNILITEFQNVFGRVRITDFMPIRKQKNIHYARMVFRKVECISGSLKMTLNFAPRFNYGRDIASFKITDTGVMALSKKQKLFLQSPVPLVIKGNKAKGIIELKKKDIMWFVLQHGKNDFIKNESCEKILVKTKEYWPGWLNKCSKHRNVFKRNWHDVVSRSGLVLKLLTNSLTGSIAAAATTSLPEEIGGSRNWDYRFAWIRDASFTSQALFHLGHIKEAKRFISWIESVISNTNDPSKIQIMYGLHGQTNLKEKTLRNLSGYKGSAPVRIGNGACIQKQLDIYGELIKAIYDISHYGRKVSRKNWLYVKNIVDYVCKVWNTKDSGIWEVRGGPRHFVYSKLMCWVAVDRGIKIAEQRMLDASLEEWKKIRAKIRKTIIEKGFNKRLNSFVQDFDSETLDASNLLIPLMGFLPFNDSKVLGTINITLRKLTSKKGFVRRYESEDGLSGSEGAFLLCSFWLVIALTLSGRIKKAENIFSNILKQISPLGLFAEEIDTKTNQQLGNFPQAFSHIGLINSALYLSIASGKKHKWPQPIGF